MKQVLGAEQIWLVFGGALLVAVLLGLVGHAVLFRVAERIARNPRTTHHASGVTASSLAKLCSRHPFADGDPFGAARGTSRARPR